MEQQNKYINFDIMNEEKLKEQIAILTIETIKQGFIDLNENGNSKD